MNKQYLRTIFICLTFFSILLEVTASTVITSQSMKMSSGPDDKQTYHFSENVELRSIDLKANCDKLAIIIKSKNGQPNLEALDPIEKIVATGNVCLQQDTKTILAGHVIIFPQEGKIILEENPIIKDSAGELKGSRIVYNNKTGKAKVEGSKNGQKPQITFEKLPSILDPNEASDKSNATLVVKKL